MCKHERHGEGAFSFGALCFGMALAFVIGALGGGRLKETDTLAACTAVGAYTLAGHPIRCARASNAPQGK